MKRIVITAATERELSVLIDAAGGKRQSQAACGKYHEGVIGSCEIIAAVTGLGKVNTAMGTTFLLDCYNPDLLVNTGCCGAYAGCALAIGDIVIATSETYGDEGVETLDGWTSLETIGIPLHGSDGRRIFNEFPLDVRTGAKAMAFARENGFRVKEGKFVTVSTCSGTEQRGRVLSRRFGAVCENMEGAAAAHVALSHGVDCMEVRGISNHVEDRDISRWNVQLAADEVQKFLLQFLHTFF